MDPRVYDALHRGLQEDIPFWLGLAREAAGPILELGCGTGRVYLPLLRAGFAAWGVDYDLDMLRHLLLRAGEARSRARLLGADLRALPFVPGYFALMIMPCNTFSTFDAQGRREVLRAAARSLRPGGLLALSVPNPALIATLPAEGESEPEGLGWHPESGNPVQVSSAWQRRGATWEVVWHYDHLWPDGAVERTTVRQTHFLVSPVRQQQEFLRAGFRVLGLYGDFARQPWDETTPYAIWVLRLKAAPR